jgi:uncharacterized membrane protein
MTTTVSALYDRAEDAHNAVRDLVDNGFPNRNISVVLSDAAGEYAAYHGEPLPDDALDAGSGALVGGLAGLVIGLVALAIPGIGPVIAAGPIAAAIVGAGAGAVTGGIIGSLVDLGVDEDYAEYYSEGIRRGGTLVTVYGIDNVSLATDILNRYHPIDIEERADQWRDQGWTAYDPDLAPYTVEEIERERARYGGSHYDVEMERSRRI